MGSAKRGAAHLGERGHETVERAGGGLAARQELDAITLDLEAEWAGRKRRPHQNALDRSPVDARERSRGSPHIHPTTPIAEEENHMDSIPDSEKIADAAKSLGEAAPRTIEGLAKLFPGWAMRSAQRAESYATDLMLSDLKKIKSAGAELGISDQCIGELMADAARRHGRNANLDATVELARPLIKPNSKPEKVNEGWAESFAEHAERAYDDEARAEWARVLAGEVNRPGSFSKRAMALLEDMSQEEAEAFKNLCSNTMHPYASNLQDMGVVDPIVVLEADEGRGTYNDGGYSVYRLGIPSSLGLVDMGLEGSRLFYKGIPSLFLVGRRILAVFNDGDAPVKVTFSGGVMLPVGRELANLCKLGTARELPAIIEKKLVAAGLRCEWSALAPDDLWQS